MKTNPLLSLIPKMTLFFCLLFAATSCIPVTNYTSSTGGCPQAFAAGDKILVGEMKGVSANRSYVLYEKLSAQLTAAGLQPAYTTEQEIYLRMKGIKPDLAPDSINLAKMQQMGYAYYLKPTVGNLASGTGYVTASAAEMREMQQYNTPEDASETTATLRYEVYSTASQKLLYTLVTTTKMIGLSLPNNDYENGTHGQTTVNASTVSLAMNKALKKSTKKLLQNCNCCQ